MDSYKEVICEQPATRSKVTASAFMRINLHNIAYLTYLEVATSVFVEGSRPTMKSETRSAAGASMFANTATT